MKARDLASALAIGLLAAGTALATPESPKSSAMAHPLAGKIWAPKAKRFTSFEATIDRLVRARFILLGERHDNPEHHRIQARLVGAVMARGRRPAVAFEMFRSDQQRAIDAHLATHPKDADGLGKAAAWSSGWPAWKHYAPIAKAALDLGAPLFAANLARGESRRIARQGLGALGPARRAALGLDRPVPGEILDGLGHDIVEGHCRLIPLGRTGPMARAQLARDAQIATVLAKAAGTGGDGAILIAGAGHVRRDRGVPIHLARIGATGGPVSVVTLAPIEVTAGMNDPAAYAATYGAKGLPFDFVWFTVGRKRTDPCIELRKRFQGSKKKP
jgi:uncharacterized iron-regulated protein